MKKKKIFITWHYTTHGIAYLKHILSAYFKYGLDVYNQGDFSQEEMNKVFAVEAGEKLRFDKVFYLTSNQKSFDKLSLRRIDYIDNILEKDNIIKNDPDLKNIWAEIIELRKEEYYKYKKFPRLDDEINYVRKKYKKNFQKWQNSLWRDIHHYEITEQVSWFGRYSNAKEIYKNGEIFINKEFDISDFRDPLQIAKKVTPFITELKEKYLNASFIINASLGSNETQVVWQVLSELNFLPENTTLIQTYDKKEKIEDRFKPFVIKKIPNKIVTEISSQIKLYDKEVKSESRILAELKMKHYLKSGFAILILGERGIGKSRLAEKFVENRKFISVNCASFTNNLIAESILFGHKKGSFTDAKEDKKGVFEEADGGILFLDEIHNLDKLVQTKLMKALQTDQNNRFTIIPVGGSEEDKKDLNLTIILASNNSIKELRKKLLPDFYDRVTQLVIELPPLRDSKQDIEQEFQSIWDQLQFNQKYPYEKNIKKDKKLINWIKQLELFGNYRDLQKIAIYYKTYLDFDEKIKEILKEKNAFEFTRKEFNKYISYNEYLKEIEFPEDKKAEEIIDKFKAKLAHWVINKYHGAPNAAAHFKEVGGKTTVATLYKWQKLIK